jgi:hypothetical protein
MLIFKNSRAERLEMEKGNLESKVSELKSQLNLISRGIDFEEALKKGKELETCSSLETYARQGIATYLEQTSDQESTAIIAFLVNNTLMNLYSSLQRKSERGEDACIQNLRTISSALKRYRGFDYTAENIEKNFSGRTFTKDQRDEGYTALDKHVYQILLRRLRNITPLEVNIPEYYIVGNKIDRAAS